MRNRPSSNGEFPQKCVEVISTKAVAWSGQLAEDDALAILYMTVQPYCLWHLPWTMFWHGTSHNCPSNNRLLVCGTCQCIHESVLHVRCAVVCNVHLALGVRCSTTREHSSSCVQCSPCA